MFDFNQFKEILDKIINLPRIDDADESSVDDCIKYVDNNKLRANAITNCLRLLSHIIINLMVDLKIVKPGNKISVAVNSVISNFNDNSIGTLLNTIYNEVNRKPENFDDYIYQEHVMVICKQIKIVSEYIIADSSILNDIIKEISIILPSILWWSRVLQTRENINNNEVK